MRLNIGCGNVIEPGFLNVDRVDGPGVDIVWDIERTPWPIEDAAASEVRASHILEHVRDLNAVMREAHRVLRPAGVLTIVVPYGVTLWALGNPEHCRFFNHLTFRYYCDDFRTTDAALPGGYRMVDQRLVQVHADDVWEGIRTPSASLFVQLQKN